MFDIYNNYNLFYVPIQPILNTYNTNIMKAFIHG